MILQLLGRSESDDEQVLLKKRERLIQHLIREDRIRSESVVKAMSEVPRHLFVPDELRVAAYQDSPLEIGERQTISAPHMVGIMVELLDLRPGLRVLEVGGGSGYHAAIVAHIVGESGHVYSMERIPILAEHAREALEAAGLAESITVIVGDGSVGLPEEAPFDRIFVSCAAPYTPEALVDQLAEDGVLLIPVGSMYVQTLLKIVKKNGKAKAKEHGACVFVPLIGENGFRPR